VLGERTARTRARARCSRIVKHCSYEMYLPGGAYHPDATPCTTPRARLILFREARVFQVAEQGFNSAARKIDSSTCLRLDLALFSFSSREATRRAVIPFWRPSLNYPTEIGTCRSHPLTERRGHENRGLCHHLLHPPFFSVTGSGFTG